MFSNIYIKKLITVNYLVIVFCASIIVDNYNKRIEINWYGSDLYFISIFICKIFTGIDFFFVQFTSHECYCISISFTLIFAVGKQMFIEGNHLWENICTGRKPVSVNRSERLSSSNRLENRTNTDFRTMSIMWEDYKIFTLV